MRALVTTSLSWLLLLSMAPQTATAVPVTVRARTHVTLVPDRTDQGVEFRGQLLDDAGQPVAGERVHVEIPGRSTATATTDGSGSFTIIVPRREVSRLEAMHGQRLPWTVQFDGDRHYGGIVRSDTFDLDRRATTLQVTAEPQVVGLDDTEVRVHVDLESARGPVVDADVRVQVGDGSELVGTTGAVGRATFLIRAGLLGDAGRYRIRARFLGDHLHAGAAADTSLRVLLPTRLTLRVGREGDPRMGRYRFSGRLADVDGPIPDATIAIIATAVGETPTQAAQRGGPALLQTIALTDASGIYLTAVLGQDFLGDLSGELELHAVFRPDDERHQSATSRPVRVRVPPPPGLPARWYVIGLVLTLAALGLAQLVRHHAPSTLWRRWVAWRGREATPPPPADPRADPPFVAPATARQHAQRALNRVAGTVVDGHSQRPIAGAEVRLTMLADGSAQTVLADLNARFSLPNLAPGDYRFSVSAPGYLQRELPLSIPHAGSLDGARYSLVAIRRRIRDDYARVVDRFEGSFAWGVDTPQEAETRLQRGGADALGELRGLVERAWFAQVPPSRDDALRARQIAEHLGRDA